MYKEQIRCINQAYIMRTQKKDELAIEYAKDMEFHSAVYVDEYEGYSIYEILVRETSRPFGGFQPIIAIDDHNKITRLIGNDRTIIRKELHV